MLHTGITTLSSFLVIFLDGLPVISCPLYSLNTTELVYGTSQICTTGNDKLWRTKIETLAFLLFEFFHTDELRSDFVYAL